MPIQETATKQNIFLVSSTELLFLKNKIGKVNQEKDKYQKQLDSCVSNLENSLLKFIPPGHQILSIINSKIKTKEDRTILRCFVEGTFDKENISIRKTGYTVKIFNTCLPLVINPEDLNSLIKELNVFWLSQVEVHLEWNSPYIYFRFLWL